MDHLFAVALLQFCVLLAPPFKNISMWYDNFVFCFFDLLSLFSSFQSIDPSAYRAKHVQQHLRWIVQVNHSPLLSQLTHASNFARIFCAHLYVAVCFYMSIFTCFCSFWRGAGGTCCLEKFWSPFWETLNRAPHLGLLFYSVAFISIWSLYV